MLCFKVILFFSHLQYFLKQFNRGNFSNRPIVSSFSQKVSTQVDFFQNIGLFFFRIPSNPVQQHWLDQQHAFGGGPICLFDQWQMSGVFGNQFQNICNLSFFCNSIFLNSLQLHRYIQEYTTQYISTILIIEQYQRFVGFFFFNCTCSFCLFLHFDQLDIILVTFSWLIL